MLMMHARLLLCLWMLVGLCACNRGDHKSCDTQPVGEHLRFRLVDTGGHDLLYPEPGRILRDGFHCTQPCNSDSLAPLFTVYKVPGTSDSGITFKFEKLRTPDYGAGGECMRFYLNWHGDIDTLDWHFKIEEKDGCIIQVIDYMSYNGVQSIEKYDQAYEYYPLVKKYP